MTTLTVTIVRDGRTTTRTVTLRDDTPGRADYDGALLLREVSKAAYPDYRGGSPISHVERGRLIDQGLIGPVSPELTIGEQRAQDEYIDRLLDAS